MPSELKRLAWTSIGDLNKLTHVNLGLQKAELRKKCITTHTLYKHAEEFRISGDEERAYICYMRFWEAAKELMKDAEFRKEKSYYEAILGTSNLKLAVRHAEQLSESLERRYESANEAIKWEKKCQEEEQERLSQEKDIPESNGVDNHHEVTPALDDDDLNLGNSITSMQLYNLMDRQKYSCLIIDTRPDNHYEESHMHYSECINIPEEIIQPGMTCAKLEKALLALATHSEIEKWKMRGSKDFIILLDWNSNVTDVNTKTVLHSIKEALTTWDRTLCLKRHPLILDGGYASWHRHYPMITTNPMITVPDTAKHNDLDEITLDFVYPSWDENIEDNVQETSKADLAATKESFFPDVIPAYDRTNKPLSLIHI